MTKIANGWALYNHRIFALALASLKEGVAALAKANPSTYKTHPKTKLLKSVYDAITERVPVNPDDPAFRLGKTLGKGNGHWRRVKNGLPTRYRLFFRFNSTPMTVIYVWLNDETTLRKAGAKTDCYAVFERMLKRGEVPQNFNELLKQSAKENGERK